MPAIILFCGLPGVGKTTLASSVASLIHATLLSSDKIRKEMIHHPTYSSSERHLVYVVLVMLAKYLSGAGIDCILDATFNRERSRSEVREKLGQNDIRLFVIECVCPEDVIIRRLSERKNDYSDADHSIYAKMKNIYEPVAGEHLVVDTSLPTEMNIQKILSYVFGAGKPYRKNA